LPLSEKETQRYLGLTFTPRTIKTSTGPKHYRELKKTKRNLQIVASKAGKGHLRVKSFNTNLKGIGGNFEILNKRGPKPIFGSNERVWADLKDSNWRQ